MQLSSRTAAVGWTFTFAALSFYWTPGGSWLATTQSEQILRLAENRWFLLIWRTGLLKFAAGLVALSPVQHWGDTFFRCRHFGAWAVGAPLLLYGGATLALRAPMALGLLETPTSMQTVRTTWHLALWDPYFVSGSVLFLLCAFFARRVQRRGLNDPSNDKVAL